MNAADYQKKVDELIEYAFYRGWHAHTTEHGLRDMMAKKTDQLRAELLAAIAEDAVTYTQRLGRGHRTGPGEGVVEEAE